MTALSIRRMNFTLQTMEQIQSKKDAAWYASLSEARRNDKTHYWFIERKAKRGNKWIIVRDLQATKSEAAELFVKYFRSRTPKCRLRHILVY